MLAANVFSEQRNKKVLVVDDCLGSLKRLSAVFDRLGCDVTMAFDGQDAIPLLINRQFDLVILDWQMPQMGGRETLLLMDRLMHENKQHKNRRPIPVVIYTGHSEEELELPLVKHFSYTGFINKRQAFSSMLRSFNFILRAI